MCCDRAQRCETVYSSPCLSSDHRVRKQRRRPVAGRASTLNDRTWWRGLPKYSVNDEHFVDRQGQIALSVAMQLHLLSRRRSPACCRGQSIPCKQDHAKRCCRYRNHDRETRADQTTPLKLIQVCSSSKVLLPHQVLQTWISESATGLFRR